MAAPVNAILWAQWRTLANFRRGDGLGGMILPVLTFVFWYGLWIALAVVAMFVASNPAGVKIVEFALPRALMFILLYWQLSPILTASLGASLDMKKVLVYPVPYRQLFYMEVLLRITTCVEMLLLLSGIVIGLLLNPVLESQFAGVAVIPFVLFNLLLAAGLRNQIERWMARRRVRELIVLVIVLLAALPQLLAVTGVPASVRRLLVINTGAFFPWSATAELSLGRLAATNWAVLLAWTVGAYFFGRWQFERSLRFDMAAAQSEDRAPVQSGSWLDRLYRLPSLVFPDPLAAVIEKELRSLSRTPRFRLVFIMGFTFGVIVFLPIVLRGGSGTSSDYLALVSAYALLLLGDVAFWNVFGFDRGAAQLYFLLPVPISRVMIGKNLAASFFIVLEITAITAIWILIRMPVSLGKIVESYASVMIFSVYLIGAGNLSSIYYPRAVNPEKSTGAGSAGRIRALLLFIYPVAAIPVLLAYGARYAFDSQLAFCLVLAFAALAGAGFYWIALDSAITKAEERKEKLLRVLSESAGPVQLS